VTKSKGLYTLLHNVIEFHFCCWDNICSIFWNEMCTINMWFYDGLTSLFYFLYVHWFLKKRVKNNQLLKQNVYFNGYINNCRMDFFKVTKDLLCLHKSDGSGKFGQAHGQYLDLIWASPRAIRLIIVNIQWHVPP